MSLRRTPLSVRVFTTSILLTLGLGYLLSMVYLYAKKVRPHQDQGHGLVQGIANSYHGTPSKPRLIVSLEGSMSSTVSANEFRTIFEWVEAGGTEEGYPGAVADIIENNCGSCHDEGGYLPKVTNYEEAQPLTLPNGGVDIQRLARMTHVHLLGIPLLFYILGALFVRTRYPEKLKAVLVVLPFVAIVWDIAHWWLTRMDPENAVGVLVGGALMSVGFLLQWTMTFWDAWAPARKGDTKPLDWMPPPVD